MISSVVVIVITVVEFMIIHHYHRCEYHPHHQPHLIVASSNSCAHSHYCGRQPLSLYHQSWPLYHLVSLALIHIACVLFWRFGWPKMLERCQHPWFPCKKMMGNGVEPVCRVFVLCNVLWHHLVPLDSLYSHVLFVRKPYPKLPNCLDLSKINVYKLCIFTVYSLLFA